MGEVIVEDDDAAFVSYFPESAWEFWSRANRPFYSMYHSGSYHLTFTPGAYVTFAFNGSFIEYYSDLNLDHGAFTVSIDGRFVFEGNSYSSSVAEQRLLFSTALPPGRHLLTVTNTGNGTATGIDYFCYLPAVAKPATSGNGTAAPETTTRSNGAETTTRSNGTAGLVAGLASTCALLVVAVIMGVYFLVRARRRRGGIDLRDCAMAPPPYEANVSTAVHDSQAVLGQLKTGASDARQDKLRVLRF